MLQESRLTLLISKIDPMMIPTDIATNIRLYGADDDYDVLTSGGGSRSR